MSNDNKKVLYSTQSFTDKYFVCTCSKNLNMALTERNEYIYTDKTFLLISVSPTINLLSNGL